MSLQEIKERFSTELETLWVSVTASEILEVSSIIVKDEYRGRGIGTEVMKSLCLFADREGLTMALTPDNEYGSSKTFLTAWYKSFGFRPNKGRRKNFLTQCTMVRDPS
jgi:GNAT superfamily N-acetyltransferase